VHPFGDVFEDLYVGSFVIVEAWGVDQDNAALVQVEFDNLWIFGA